jgi:hypothetical protein
MRRLTEGTEGSAALLIFSNNLVNALLFWVIPGLLLFVYVLVAYTGFAQGAIISFSPMKKKSIMLTIFEFGAYLTFASIGVRVGSALLLNYGATNTNALVMDLTLSLLAASILLMIAAIYEIKTFTNMLKNVQPHLQF